MSLFAGFSAPSELVTSGRPCSWVRQYPRALPRLTLSTLPVAVWVARDAHRLVIMSQIIVQMMATIVVMLWSLAPPTFLGVLQAAPAAQFGQWQSLAPLMPRLRPNCGLDLAIFAPDLSCVLFGVSLSGIARDLPQRRGDRRIRGACRLTWVLVCACSAPWAPGLAQGRAPRSSLCCRNTCPLGQRHDQHRRDDGRGARIGSGWSFRRLLAVFLRETSQRAARSGAMRQCKCARLMFSCAA